MRFLTLILFVLGSTAAWCCEEPRDYERADLSSFYTFHEDATHNYDHFLPGRETQVGALIFNELEVEVSLKRTASAASNDFNLFFYTNNGKKQIGYILGHKGYSPEIKFIGMKINSPWRGQGLSRAFVKFFILMSDFFQLEMITGKMEKPALAKILAGLSFEPLDESGKIFLNRSHVGDSYSYFSETVEYSEKFRRSQHLQVLEAQPEDYEIVYVQTPYRMGRDRIRMRELLSKIETHVHFY